MRQIKSNATIFHLNQWRRRKQINISPTIRMYGWRNWKVSLPNKIMDRQHLYIWLSVHEHRTPVRHRWVAVASLSTAAIINRPQIICREVHPISHNILYYITPFQSLSPLAAWMVAVTPTPFTTSILRRSDVFILATGISERMLVRVRSEHLFQKYAHANINHERRTSNIKNRVCAHNTLKILLKLPIEKI